MLDPERQKAALESAEAYELKARVARQEAKAFETTAAGIRRRWQLPQKEGDHEQNVPEAFGTRPTQTTTAEDG